MYIFVRLCLETNVYRVNVFTSIVGLIRICDRSLRDTCLTDV